MRTNDLRPALAFVAVGGWIGVVGTAFAQVTGPRPPAASQPTAPHPAPQDPGGAPAPLGRGLERRNLDSAYEGVVVNQTVTMAGYDFYQAFVAAWRDKPEAERYTLTIVERPSVRLGTQVWVEFSRRRVFQTALPPARARIPGIGQAAADIAYENVVESELQNLLLRDPDLGADEI